MNYWSEFENLNNELKIVEQNIISNLTSRNKLLNSIVLELINSGGKRIRPAMVILSSKFGNSKNSDQIIKLSCAVEILHSATLVHDDIIDNSTTRRGIKTVSSQYGNNLALYAGDFLFTKAVLILSENIPLANLKYLALGIKSICEGEVDQYQDKYRADISILTYLKRIGRKTALLFSASCAVGAHLSETNKQNIKNLGLFGFAYGMAFQIRDDIKNLESEDEQIGSDLLEGIITLPVIYALLENPKIKVLLNDLFQTKDNSKIEKMNHIVKLIKQTKGIEKSKLLILKYLNRCAEFLSTLKENEAKQILFRLINDF